jgi:hypothetical protein
VKKSKSRLPWTSVLGAAAVGLLGYACTPPLTPEDARLVPTTMTAVSATTRTATVGSTLTDYPAVTVRDQDGIGLPEVNVSFTASTGTQPSPSTKSTNADGQAALTSWTVPQTSGTVTMTASVPGFPITAQTFTVTLNPGPASTAVVNPGTSSNGQSATAGQPVAVPPSVLVRDQYNNAVSGVNVTFAVTGGAGTVVPTTPVQTNAQGIATATSWTLGAALGANTLRATVAGVTAPVDFTATGVAGTPASIIVGGTGNSQGQTAIAGTSVTNAPVVLVRDAGNNPVSGVTVRFAIGGGAGKILTGASDATGQNTQDVTTGANGQASIFAWRLGTVGANTLTATLPAHGSVNAFVFTATAIVGPPTQIAVGNQAWGFTRTGTAHGGTPSIVLRDAGGNLVSGHTVTWGTPTNSTLSATASSTSSAQGVAAFPRATVNWTATGAVASNMTIVASVSGTTLTQTFTSKIVGAPTGIAVHAGNNQSASVNSAVAVDPAAKVVDATGDPVPGTSVTFAVTGGGGSVSGTPALTDSVGVATVVSWTMGATIGVTNTLRASLTSTPTTFVDFGATPTAGAPASMVSKPGNPTTGLVNSSQSMTVIVRDAGSNPVQGASVTFAPVSTSGVAPGNAAVTGSPATTNAAGEATVTWRLDTLARVNTLQATTPGASGTITTLLTASSTPLAASKLIIVSGNNQSAPASSQLPLPPTVRAADQYNNPVAGQNVTWAPAQAGLVNCGGGAVASCQSASASNGNAVTTWTLGAASGTQTLQASLSATPTATASFSATTGDPCATSTSVVPGTTYNGSLAIADCQVASYYLDKYSYAVPASTTVQLAFTYSTAAFHPYLLARLWPGAAWQASLTTTGSVTHNYVLGPGTYNFEASSNSTNQTGAYSLVTTLNPAIPAGCANFIVTKGISVAHSMDLNCNFTSAGQTGTAASKVYWLFVPANTSATVRMNAGSLADPYLECWDGTSSLTFVTGCFNDDGGGSNNALLTIPTAGTGRYILIRATHYNAAGTGAVQSGTYTLIIDP